MNLLMYSDKYFQIILVYLLLLLQHISWQKTEDCQYWTLQCFIQKQMWPKSKTVLTLPFNMLQINSRQVNSYNSVFIYVLISLLFLTTKMPVGTMSSGHRCLSIMKHTETFIQGQMTFLSLQISDQSPKHRGTTRCVCKPKGERAQKEFHRQGI